MRSEHDQLGTKELPAEALYGIHALRASENFPDTTPFSLEWYKACGWVKLACYHTLASFIQSGQKEYPETMENLNLPSPTHLKHLQTAAQQVAAGLHFDAFIVPAIQGGAGTSINMNINEIICNVALREAGEKPGSYHILDPIEDANCYQSTNDVIPTALKVASLKLLEELEVTINAFRQQVELQEQAHRHTPRIAYTQLQEAVPSTYGQLFSSYAEALSRDWWRVSKCNERIKTVNLGGGAIGSALTIPRYYVLHVVPELKKLTHLPLAQSENLFDTTANLDSFVEIHATLKAHAVNLEKIAQDLRLLASNLAQNQIHIPAKQTGSSIMPGKINPVICEYIIACAQKIQSNDQLLGQLCAQGQLDLNAMLPQIGHALLESLRLLKGMNQTLLDNVFRDLEIDSKKAETLFFRSTGLCTALLPHIGYHKAQALAQEMKKNNQTIFEANASLNLLDTEKLKEILKPTRLLQKGFSLKDLS